MSSTISLTVPALSPFSAEQVADWYFLTQIGATDSASAGTAMATGYKTDDGNIAWLPGDPVGGSLTTIAETLRSENGFAIGVVSTVPFSHATPAAFVSHNVSRNNYTQIANEIIYTVMPEVVIGGGNRNWGGNYLSATDQKALEDGDTAYTYVGRQAGVDGGDALSAAANTIADANGDGQLDGKLFGLFGGNGGNFDYHQASDTPGSPSITQGSIENPTLAEAVNATLAVLNQDSQGFFVMFEQGDIDWSNHANDFENMIGGVWDLDMAVRAAEDFVDGEGDGINWSNTLMLVTADHSNSYMRNQVALGAGDLPAQEAAGGFSPYGSGWAYPDGSVTYRSGGHTDELVTLQARGAGADLFAGHAVYEGIDNVVDNTSIYQVMLDAATSGVKHIMLFIGDGMNISHEVAASRYLYGVDDGLAWDDWGTESVENSWAGYATTWDVTTYNKYASANGLPSYDRHNFDPYLGYNPELGGTYAGQGESDIIQSYAQPGQEVVGTAGNDTMIVSSAAGVGGVVAGEMGNDIIVAGDGDDVLRGDRNSRSSGGKMGGDDLIYGGKGNDRLGGKGGNDQLFGQDGDDQIWGDDGDDFLWGGKGNDVVTGGKGGDTFVLALGEGTDTITDFQKGIDQIGLYGGITFSNLTRTGHQIAFNGEVLAVLTGVDTTTLGEGSFVLVNFDWGPAV